MAADALKGLVKVGAWLFALPYVGVALLVVTGTPTSSAVAYLSGLGILIVGLMTLPTGAAQRRRVFGRPWPRGVSRAAAIGLLAVALVRIAGAGRGATLHFAPDARLVDRLIDERDIALSGTRALVATGFFHDDVDELPDVMRAAYLEMHAQEGDTPSPVLATYLGLQTPAAHDLIILEPRGERRPTAAVIFLHGYGGSFSLPCWQVAEAIAPLGVLTACPSTRYLGDWGSSDGEATVRHTLAALGARGITRVVLAGLSNGGYGASALAPRLRGRLAGLVLVSGAEPTAADAGVPALVLHGRADEMTPFEDSVAYVARHSGASLVALEGGHFAMLVRREVTNRALREFVARVLAPPPA